MTLALALYVYVHLVRKIAHKTHITVLHFIYGLFWPLVQLMPTRGQPQSNLQGQDFLLDFMIKMQTKCQNNLFWEGSNYINFKTTNDPFPATVVFLPDPPLKQKFFLENLVYVGNEVGHWFWQIDKDLNSPHGLWCDTVVCFFSLIHHGLFIRRQA